MNISVSELEEIKENVRFWERSRVINILIDMKMDENRKRECNFCIETYNASLSNAANALLDE